MSVIRNLTDFNSMMLNQVLHEGMVAIDATLGNGYDAQRILQAIGKTGQLFGFDVQEDAIVMTRDKLRHLGYRNYKLFHMSHDCLLEMFDKDSIDFIVYNLGYMPGVNKTVSTAPDSTLMSIRQGLQLLKVGGIMSVSIYSGHESGKKEQAVLDPYFETLDTRTYHVTKYQFTNQPDSAPYVYWIERKK
jgi:hypothetical protein